MAGSIIAVVHNSNNASGTSLTTNAGGSSGSITTQTGDSLIALVTYDGGDDTPSLPSTFGTWVEDTSLQRLSQSPRFHVYTINSTGAASGTIALTTAARVGRGIMVIQLRGCTAYQGGVFPAYNAPGNGTGNITSGNFNVTNQPNFLVGFGWDLDGTGTAPPVTSGNGFTSRFTAWLFGAGTDNARIVDRRVTANGNVAVTFDSGFGSHTYACLLFAFTESGGSAYSLTCDQGSYALTGQTAGLNKGQTLVLDQGLYTLLGSTALVDVEVDLDQGSYALSGQAAGLLYAIRMLMDQGAYALTGRAASLLYSGAPAVAVWRKWLPLKIAQHLPWLKRYNSLVPDAVAEANGSAVWARRGKVATWVYYIDVHSVPGYPRTGFTNP